jgi:hypothetical protein
MNKDTVYLTTVYDPCKGDSHSVTAPTLKPGTTGDHGNGLYDNCLAAHVLTAGFRSKGVSSGNSLDDIFDDRLGLIRSKMDLILLQLKDRKGISRSILYQIDSDSCRVQSMQYDLGPRAYIMGADRLTLEKLKLDLERQRRMEQVSYFRDTGMLNKELKDTLIEYLEEVQKSQFLSGEDDR